MAGSCAKLTERAAFLAALVVGVLTLHGGAVEAARGGDTAAQPAAPEQSYTNRLIQSNNPYLLLHAHNPVDWYPWGPEALARAKRENRPIFVSIGYSTCYWCHVAERTIYSDPEIAKLMNEWFINVKVDREQRPDLDRIHMLATHLLTGRGGWPNNVFLTPDLKPFFAGSYFPPADDAFGRPGFPTVLKAIHEAWVGRRQEMQEQADKVYSAMLDAQAPATSGAAVSVRPSDWLRVARNELLQTYDATHGGLGRGRQKFPQAPALRLLLADYRSSRDAKVLEAVTKTLNAMAFGGIHDHLGGGFHRYSTEATWSIPHFEKMLYDNAQLLQIYAEAYQITRDPLYREVAEEVAAYLSQQMMAPEGGFYAAQDAEVAGREGISYLWTRDEIESVLGKVAAERFLQVYTLTPLPGQSEADLVAGADTGVLRIRVPIVDTLQRAGGGNIVEVLASQAQARAGLLAARNRRPQPARDDKIIIAWNGMAIEALVRSGEILGNGAYVGLAKLTAGRLWNLAYEPGTGEMKREIFRGRAQTHGFLDDYALMGVAFLSLGEATGEPVWRKRAASVAAAMLRRFSDGDALATTVAAKQLLLSPEDDGDNSYPSGISAAVELLSRLYAVSGDAQYARAASRIAMHLGRVVEQSPVLWPVAVAALNRYPLPARQAASPQALGAADYAPSTADHVRVRGEVRSARGRDEIVVTIVVDGGYHINANPATFDYLIPTAVSIEGVPDMQIAYPAPRLIKPKFAPDGLKVYEGTITLRGVAAKGALAGAKSISATVRVQACNDQVCLPPATLPLKLTRRATPSSR